MSCRGKTWREWWSGLCDGESDQQIEFEGLRSTFHDERRSGDEVETNDDVKM